MRKCPRCQEFKPDEEWGRSYCKPCNAERYKEYKARNREKELARKKAYRDQNKQKISTYHKSYMKDYWKDKPHWRKLYPELAKEQEVQRRGYQTTKTIDPGLLKQKLRYWGGLCWICRINPHEHWDHVKPLSKGGLHLLANLRPSCADCNLEKSNKWPYTPDRMLSD